MNKLKIPENHSGISKTLRLPDNVIDDVQKLADNKNLSFNLCNYVWKVLIGTQRGYGLNFIN